MAKPPPKPAGSPPTISGIPQVGKTLTATDGAWTGNPDGYGKQWQRDTAIIQGATGRTYDLQPADEDHLIRVLGNAHDKGGTSVWVASESVGPVYAADIRPPDPGPEPPPSGDYPDSVVNPVCGAPLTHVWDLRTKGTGPRGEFYNGAWSGEIDSYLASLGFVRGNYDNALYLPGGPSLVKVEGYSFKGSPRLNFNGSEVEFWDCLYQDGSPTWPTDQNNNIMFDHGLRIRFNFCEWHIIASYQGSGETEFNDCLMTGQLQGFCDIGNLDDGTGQNTSTVYNRCYIPGGGVQPAWAAHVELARVPAAPGKPNNRKFILNDTMIDISACGQANAANYGGGWTGIESVGDLQVECNRSIMIGAPKVNASATVPNSVGCVWAIGNNTKLTDSIFERGCFGYCYDHSGRGLSAIDGGGNRDLDNTPLSPVHLRSISVEEAERINKFLAHLGE